MKIVPRHNQILGRIVIKKTGGAIVRPDDTANTTKFVLVDAVGPGAAAAGIKVGDLVLPNALGNIVIDGGVIFRPILDEANALALAVCADDVERGGLLIQTDNGSQYVPMDSDRAAKSLGG